MHLAIAQRALAQLGLEKLHWIVSGTAPHKPSNASARDRLAMVSIMLHALGDPRMVADDCEIRASTAANPRYTIDTIREFQNRYPAKALTLIIGGDQARDFQTWKHWEQIMSIAQIAVVRRPGSPAVAFISLCQGRGTTVWTLDLTEQAINATAIRAAFTTTAAPPELTPEVYQYALRQRLYSV